MVDTAALTGDLSCCEVRSRRAQFLHRHRLAAHSRQNGAEPQYNTLTERLLGRVRRGTALVRLGDSDTRGFFRWQLRGLLPARDRRSLPCR